MSRGPWNIHFYRLLPAYGERENTLKYVCQLRIYYCRAKCVLFAHICKLNSVLYICNIYVPLSICTISAIYTTEKCMSDAKKYGFGPKSFFPNCFKKHVNRDKSWICDKIAYVKAKRFVHFKIFWPGRTRVLRHTSESSHQVQQFG